MTYETYENNPALEFEDTDYYGDPELGLVEEDEESFEWTPDVCSYEELDYGDDVTQFVTDQAPFLDIPSPIICVDGELWNASAYVAYKAELAYQADQESKRAAYIEKLAWQVRMRRGLPTESRLGRIKRIQSDKEAKGRKFICAANAKQSPKFGSRRNNHTGRKGKRGIVVATAEVVTERRKQRRRDAKAAQTLRSCNKPQVAIPILEAEAYIPVPDQDEDEKEVADQEEQEIKVACSVAKTWIPVVKIQPTTPKTSATEWITVKKTNNQERKLKKDGFVAKGTRGRAARCTVLDFSVIAPRRPQPTRDGPSPCPPGWVFTHPSMDLRPHINETTQLCRHFQFGTCNFGSTCKFRHTYGACKFGARCTRDGCKRAHPAKAPSVVGHPYQKTRPRCVGRSTPPPPPRAAPPRPTPPPPTPPPTPPTPTPTPPPPTPPVAWAWASPPEPIPVSILKKRAWCNEPELKCVLLESGGFTLEPATNTCVPPAGVQAPPVGPPPGPPLGPPPPLVYPKPTRTCNNWAAGKKCKFGDKCHFAHFTIVPSRTCNFWASGQMCKHGSKCRFKHG